MSRAGLASAAVAGMLAAAALAQEARPPVPPGRDPGGMPIAVIGAGIDYTLAKLAQRLARDGEGELIGWDLERNDRRPFSKGTGGTAMAVASFLLEGGSARLIPVRLDPADPLSLARAVAFSAHTPSRIALLPVERIEPEARQPLLQAAARFKTVLIILPADAVGSFPALLALENVLAVEPTAEGADIAGLDGTMQRLAGSPLGVAATGKDAAALLAREPRLDAGALKRRLTETGGGTLWRAGR